MTTREFVFGVDLDGVVADFYGCLRPIAAEWVGKDVRELPEAVSYGLREWGIEDRDAYKALHRFAVIERALFETVTPINGAPAALRRLSDRGVRIRIITHRLYVPFTHEVSVQQTVRWLDHHGVPYRDLCFMETKGAVGADLYVEDAPANVEALREGGANAIVFTNSTNREVAPPRATDWCQLEEMVLKYYETWKLAELGPATTTSNGHH